MGENLNGKIFGAGDYPNLNKMNILCREKEFPPKLFEGNQGGESTD